MNVTKVPQPDGTWMLVIPGRTESHGKGSNGISSTGSTIIASGLTEYECDVYMSHTFGYLVSATFMLTRRELIQLADNSTHHYDATCRGLSKVGGFIYGWVNMMDLTMPYLLVTCDMTKLDLMCKVLESSDSPLYLRLKGLLASVSSETERVNKL